MQLISPGRKVFPVLRASLRCEMAGSWTSDTKVVADPDSTAGANGQLKFHRSPALSRVWFERSKDCWP